MHVTNILALLWCLGTGAAPSHALTVHVHVTFAPSIMSASLRDTSEHEAAAIWKVYGVDLEWTDAGAGPALCLDAVVERERKYDALSLPGVLGHVTIAPDRQAPILISFDAIDALVGPSDLIKMLPRDLAIGIVLGRVLAHEIGHVLLGSPAYHDRVGLMRPHFMSDDLVRPDRSAYRLTDQSIARLHERIASWIDTPPLENCTARDTR
jgi:hypothetical protein